MIDNYKFGEFVIKGKTYKSNIILINNTDKVVRQLENHELRLSDFDELIKFNPEILVIGTGDSGTFGFGNPGGTNTHGFGTRLSAGGGVAGGAGGNP